MKQMFLHKHMQSILQFFFLWCLYIVVYILSSVLKYSVKYVPIVWGWLKNPTVLLLTVIGMENVLSS